MHITRRAFLATATAIGGTALAREDKPKRITRVLLRSSWQTVNIGDIAHTPGVLALLEKHIPDAEVWLWPSKVDNGVDEMLKKRFPKLTIVQGTDAVKTAIEKCDFLLHGSGPSLVAQKDVAAFSQHTRKPYGVYGITYGGGGGEATRDVLSRAKFAYFRDSVSLAKAKSEGVTCPIMEFGPDGAPINTDRPNPNDLLTHGIDPQLETAVLLLQSRIAGEASAQRAALRE